MIIELKDNIKWAVLKAIGAEHDLINDMAIIENEECKNLKEIEFKVGGVELDFQRVIDTLSNSYDTMVENRAVELLQERFSGISDSLNDLEANLKHELLKNNSNN